MMGRRVNRICEIKYPSRVEGWLDVCEFEGHPTTNLKNLPWSPLYCVLQQDEQTYTAYCSEELSLTDVLFAELPRVRLDRIRRPNKFLFDAHPTLSEVPEECEGYLDGGGDELSQTSDFQQRLDLNTTLTSPLGECKSRTLPRIHFDTTLSSKHMNDEDTSYEKACRRGSAPSTPILGQKNPPEQQSTSRFTNFFSKRSNPLKRTKSVTKLERSKRGPGGLRGSRSHESLLSSHAVMSTIDLSCTGAVGVAPVHQSVLGRRHCFQVRGGPRGERYYSCGSRQERDLWIYSLRKSIAPNAEHQRRTDNSLKMWIQEAKAITPKKRYFCEINLDKTLYGRTSVKQKTDLLFWGEYFDFPDIPDINVITVNVFREGDKKKKRDKHILVGSVKIPIHDVTKTTREFTEDWYPIVSEKHDSFSRNSTKEPIPTLRIKCRFQSIDILPIEIYTDFLQYMKEHYKKVCEILEPVILVKPKEDIGQALVLLMQAHGLAGPFLTDVVALDLLRVDDQRLTFRGNSLATKSMEAFLKLTGEQYLQDTLSGPITEIITSEKDFEVDPLKAHGSLSRQQQALRNAVKNTWNSIAESHRNFPPQLRECFATFRERLIELNREDMADNLISASIFLRFLCPAILSPSLFNIKNELPSQRATRNLTLVAKTLQTLANFTRFQGKEDFMEFLNDFLEQEAPRMKEFLHQISTRSTQPPVDTVLDWPGYIDEGKQLAILHHLLSENILKLPIPRQNELIELQGVLGEITRAKLSNSFGVSQTNLSESSHSTVQTHTLSRSESGNITSNSIIKPLGNGERGIMRGVLTPSSLEKNIFRYNDPTVSPLLNQENGGINRSQNSIYSNSIQHSHSTSSISSISNHNHNNYQNHLLSTTVHHHHHKNHAPSPERYAYLQQQQQKQQHQQYKSNVYLESNASTASTPRNFNTTSHYYPTNGGGLNGRRSPSLRANTLPRNNNIIPVTTINNNGVHVEKNNSPAKNSNLIQIGLDTSSAFVRKSPTPMLKSQNNHNNNHIMQRNGSQLSLLSDRGGSQMQGSPHVNGKNAFNLDLGIPHSSLIDPPHPLHAVSARTTNHNSNMPMKLEDLDDLLKYADEQATSNGDEIKTAKVGSSTSIGHCSSGYQSIATQSQSSTSPVDLASGVNAPNANEFPTNSMKSRRALGQHISSANGKYQNSKYGNNNNNANIMNGGALAFKNPLYQLQNAIGVNGSNGTTIAINNNVGSNGKGRRPHYSQLHSRVSQQSSSLTPSSSDERLSQSNALDDSNGNTVNGLISNINGTLTSSSDKEHSLNDDCGSGTLNGNSSTLNSIAKRLTGSNNRMPRTNPLMQYKREEPIEPLAHHNHISHHLRFQRRTSLDSPHSGSDSSSEGEEVIRSEGKRRRFPRTVEQCEREIQRLQSSLDALRSHREDNGSDMGGRDSNDDLSMQHSDIKMRNIIAKLISMEKELRQEQMKMSVALTHKQRVIEAQGQQIAALDAANNRLLSALSSLRQRYETVNQSPNSSINPNHSAHC
ncbi:ras GTPase-activating protein raskol isoform X6 [Sitodiplosis mosellana]|uniref:ras GTPase-activating protein raskol isoform X6 n=1 Tax=Sitodiplosis mosellana TaxID=263140 RepID=UPI0024439B3D|nr:ras GTPase-activating protein raskol isoform X6 [Sitodiplosis mosellana]